MLQRVSLESLKRAALYGAVRSDSYWMFSVVLPHSTCDNPILSID